MNEKKSRTVIGRINGDLIMGLPAHLITEEGLLITSPVEHFIVGSLGATIITRNTRYTVCFKREQ